MKAIYFASFGLNVVVFIYNLEEIRKIAGSNPFLPEFESQADKLHVSFFLTKPETSKTEQISGMVSGNDRFAISGKTAYLFCPDGYGKTRFSNTFFESKLKIKATTRNWRTVNILAEM